MHLRDQLQKYKLLFLSIFLLVGCTQTASSQIKFKELVLHDNAWAENPSFTIDSDFEYSSIIFRLYFSEDDGWRYLTQFTINNIKDNSFKIGNDMADYTFSNCNMYVQYGEIIESYQCIELVPYEKEFNQVVGFHIVSKDLDYNETPLCLSRFSGEKDYVSIVHTWKDNIENMNMETKVPTDHVRYYVFTYQLVK